LFQKESFFSVKLNKAILFGCGFGITIGQALRNKNTKKHWHTKRHILF